MILHQAVDFFDGFVFGTLLVVMTTFIMLVCRFVRIQHIDIRIARKDKFYTNPVWLLVFAAIEELFARALLLGWLGQRIGFITAFVVSSVIFTVLHIPNGKVTIISIANLLLSATFLGVIYMKYGLLSAIGAHYAWNLMQWTILGFPFYSKPVGRFLQIYPVTVEWQSGGEFGPEYSVVTTIILFAVATSLLAFM